MKSLALSGLVLSALISLPVFADAQTPVVQPTSVSATVDADDLVYAFLPDSLSMSCPENRQPISTCVGTMAAAIVVHGDKQALSGTYFVSAKQLAYFYGDDTIKSRLFDRITKRLAAVKNKFFGNSVLVTISGENLSIGGVNLQAEAIGRVKMWIDKAGTVVQQGSVWVSNAENSGNQAAANATQAAKDTAADLQRRANEAGANLAQNYQALKDRAGQVARDQAKKVRDGLNTVIGDDDGSKDPQPKNP